MDYLKIFESEEFKKYIRENLIEYKTINGMKVVDPDFITNLQKIDPIHTAEKYLKGLGLNMPEEEKQKHEGALGLLNHLFVKSVTDEVTAMTFDTKFGSSIKEYLQVVDRLGFKPVYKKAHKVIDDGFWESEESAKKYLTEHGAEFKILSTSKRENSTSVDMNIEYTEYEMMFWHQDHNLLLHLDTYHGGVNSASVIFNAKVKDANKRHDLQCSNGYIQYTNIISGDFDAREMLSHNLSKFLIGYEPVEAWSSFENSLYSHLTHKGFGIGDENWDTTKAEKLNKLPEHVLEKVISQNIKFDKATKKVCIERFGKFAAENTVGVLNSLSDDVIENCMVEDVLFSGLIRPEKLITNELLGHFENEVDKDTLPKLIMDVAKFRKIDGESNRQKLIERINGLTSDELKVIEEGDLRFWDSFGKADLAEAAKERRETLDASNQRPRRKIH